MYTIKSTTSCVQKCISHFLLSPSKRFRILVLIAFRLCNVNGSRESSLCHSRRTLFIGTIFKSYDLLIIFCVWFCLCNVYDVYNLWLLTGTQHCSVGAITAQCHILLLLFFVTVFFLLLLSTKQFHQFCTKWHCYWPILSHWFYVISVC